MECLSLGEQSPIGSTSRLCWTLSADLIQRLHLVVGLWDGDAATENLRFEVLDEKPRGQTRSWRGHRAGRFRMNDRLIHDHVDRRSLFSCLKSMMLNPV